MINRKILLGITGSIAAYKSIFLVRLLMKAGAQVKVVATPAAKDFVPFLTLSTLSRNPVLTELIDEANWNNHVELGRWADIMLIAPLSCNTLAKMAQGSCDNLLLATWLSATCPVAVAPAMDEDMWLHPATKRNLQTIEGFGHHIIPVGDGELASGLYGEGRMAEPEQIFAYLEQFFGKGELSGRNALVTAGPTYENIDAVRFIGNHSSGKMGIALANELAGRGAKVTLVMGPGTAAPGNGMEVLRVNTAEEMYNACVSKFPGTDITIMAAAVADYKAAKPVDGKIKKGEGMLQLQLEPTRDILKALGAAKKKDQVLVGFALETDNEKQFAQKKLQEKNADLIVLNSLKDEGAGFGIDTNQITIFDRDAKEYAFSVKPKTEVAKDIVDTIIKKFYA